MSCRKAVCQECATTWDGIHYCAGCLAERRRPTRSRGDWLGLIGVVAAASALFWLVSRLMVWAGVLALQL